jgi:hypothetical protein
MTHGAFLYNNEKSVEDNDKPFGLSSYSTPEKKPGDDNEPRGSLSFSTPKEKNQETSMSLPTCCHLLQLETNVENDN